MTSRVLNAHALMYTRTPRLCCCLGACSQLLGRLGCLETTMQHFMASVSTKLDQVERSATAPPTILKQKRNMKVGTTSRSRPMRQQTGSQQNGSRAGSPVMPQTMAASMMVDIDAEGELRDHFEA